MSSEQPDLSTADSPDERSRSLDVPRWVVFVGILVVSLPLLTMSLMMVTMGWIAPPMHGPMAGADMSIIRIVGFVPLLLVLGLLYGGYRIVMADAK